AATPALEGLAGIKARIAALRPFSEWAAEVARLESAAAELQEAERAARPLERRLQSALDSRRNRAEAARRAQEAAAAARTAAEEAQRAGEAADARAAQAISEAQAAEQAVAAVQAEVAAAGAAACLAADAGVAGLDGAAGAAAGLDAAGDPAMPEAAAAAAATAAARSAYAAAGASSWPGRTGSRGCSSCGCRLLTGVLQLLRMALPPRDCRLRSPWCGVRVGEARHPGPEQTSDDWPTPLVETEVADQGPSLGQALVAPALAVDAAASSSRRRRHATFCTQCQLPRTGGQAKRDESLLKCVECEGGIEYRKWIYRCSSCPTLLLALRQLSVVRRVPLARWVPTRFARQYAAVRLQALDRVMDALDSDLPPLAQEELNLLALAVPHLLLRERVAESDEHAAVQPDPDEAGGEKDQPQQSFARLLRARMQIANAAEWLDLVTAAAQDERKWAAGHAERGAGHASHLRDAPPAPVTADAGGEPATQQETYEKLTALLPPASAEARASRPPAPPVSKCSPVERKQLPAFIRQPWLHMQLIASDKGGGKARPIVFQEVLFKLAAGTISRAELHRVSAHVGSNQHALGAESGTAALITEVQADMAAHPHWVYLGLDLENAFGTARRQDAYEQARACSPRMATLQHNMWFGGVRQLCYVQVGEQFKTLEMQEGCCQGGCSATSDFGLALSASIRDISEAYSKAFADKSSRPRLRLFVDDVCVAAPREHWLQAMRIATQCFAARGLKLRVDKTKAHVPAARSDPALAGDLAAELRPHAEFDASGLTLLGAHAEGECSTHFSFDGATLGPVQKRCEKAIAFASILKRVAHAELACRKLGPLWKLVCLVLNRALSYDACVVKPAAFLPYA
ncbi:unnamed protein product, partial [Prorocentrum cordatum]